MWPFRKSLPVPAGRKSASFLFGMGALRGSLSGATFDQFASEGYATNAVAHACINRIASSIASVDIQLYQKTKTGKLNQVEGQHALTDLLATPNPTQSGKEFFRSLVSYYLLSGNAYIYGNGIDPTRTKGKPPTELQLLNPGKMKVNAGPSLFPESFEYRPGPNAATIYPVDQISGRSAVMQFKTFNPLSPWYGLSPMVAAAFGIDIYNGGNQWNKRLLDNDARPSGALVVKDSEGKPATLTDDQYTRLQQMIEGQFSGSGNAGRPLLLEGGLEWQQMSLSAKDIDFAEGKNSAARDIGLVYGVPPQLLGIKGDSTFANYEQANLSYWTDTVLPLLAWLLEGLNRWLTPLYGPQLYLWYDEDSIVALEPRRKEKADRINTSEYMTVNEKRRAMGLDDIDGGDTLFVPSTDIPLDLAGTVDPRMHPILAGDTPQQEANAQAQGAPLGAAPAKYRKWLESLGYSADRAERLAKLTYG